MKKISACVFTIVFCLCCLTSCALFAKHSITYADNETEMLLHDGYAPKRANPGDTVVLRAGPIMDADLYFYANGVQIENTHNDSDYWEYTFIMPDEDVVITHKMSDGFIQCTNHIDANANGRCDRCGHEHIIIYVSAGTSGHFENYKCGCPYDHGSVPHYDENFDCICDACGYDMNEDYPPLVDTTIPLRNLTRCEWLNEITAEDIAEIKIIGEAVGVAPGNLKTVQSSTNEAVIARIFEEYYSLDTRPISKMDGQIDGGSGVTVKFVLKDGTTKELYINNGNYLDTDGDYFKLSSVPKFKDTDYARKVSAFINYIGTATVYDKDNNPICEIPIDELEFSIQDYSSGLFANGYEYYVDTEFGKLCFAKTEVLAQEGGSLPDVVYYEYYFIEDNFELCYRLEGKNIDELIAEYSAK